MRSKKVLWQIQRLLASLLVPSTVSGRHDFKAQLRGSEIMMLLQRLQVITLTPFGYYASLVFFVIILFANLDFKIRSY